MSPLVRSDVVFFETQTGGAVFSTGSIAWCGALLTDGGDNAVARITENVLRRFARAEPVEPGVTTPYETARIEVEEEDRGP